MKDVYESFKAHITERFSSPLFGAFSLSWVAWNHTYLFILFADAPIAYRLALAKSTVFPDSFAVVYRGVVYPLLSAISFIIIFPILSKWFFAYWHKHQTNMVNKRKEIEGLTMVTLEEANSMRRGMITDRLEFQKTLHEKDTEIENLKLSVISINMAQKATSVDPFAPKPSPEPHEGVLEIITLLAKNNGEFPIDAVYQKIKKGKLTVQHYLDKGYEAGYIQNSPINGHLQLTQLGRAFAVQAKLVS